MTHYEVYPAGWGFYSIYRCGEKIYGIERHPYRVALVFGRDRAINRARTMGKPIYTTKLPGA